MIGLLDIAREFLGHPRKEQPKTDTFRLIRPTGRYYDGYHWLWRQGVAWSSADERRRTLDCWIRLRQRHHVAWLERGGQGQ